MKVFTVLRESVKVYFKNFADLMGAYLVQGLLRAMCLTPLLFLLDASLSSLAWLCVPMYVLIVLPARQNYALALRDMLHGGRVLSPRLISFEGYFRKLGRGLLGMLKMLLWMALPITAIVLMLEIYFGKGWLATTVVGLWDVTSLDGISMMTWFKNFGPDTIGGLINLMLMVMATFILPLMGCAVHCGSRHTIALKDKKLLRGQRLKLMLLWVLGFLFFLPFAGVTLVTLFTDLKAFVMGFAEAFLTKSFTAMELGKRLYLIMAAFVLLFLPAVPLKQLIPAVAVHQRMKKVYGELETDVEA